MTMRTLDTAIARDCPHKACTYSSIFSLLHDPKPSRIKR